MKLTDLDPRWLLRDGRRVGFIFRSPTKPAWWQSCVFQPTDHNEQKELFNAALDVQGENRNYAFTTVQGCKHSCGWAPMPAPEAATFETISVTPSIDGSAGGLWHGFITSGQIVGGI